jgi:hypothetical protein
MGRTCEPGALAIAVDITVVTPATHAKQPVVGLDITVTIALPDVIAGQYDIRDDGMVTGGVRMGAHVLRALIYNK